MQNACLIVILKVLWRIMKDKWRMSKIPIVVSDITNETRLPKDMDSFWPLSDNKVKLEVLLRNFLRNITLIRMSEAYRFSSVKLPVSMSQWPLNLLTMENSLCIQALIPTSKRQTFESFPTVSILSEVDWSAFLILSNDTDVLVIATYFVQCFKPNGLIELWFRAGERLANQIHPIACPGK